MDDPLSVLDRRVRALETRVAVDEVRRISIADRLAAIEDTLKWLVRLVLGGLVMATLALVLQGGLG